MDTVDLLTQFLNYFVVVRKTGGQFTNTAETRHSIVWRNLVPRQQYKISVGNARMWQFQVIDIGSLISACKQIEVQDPRFPTLATARPALSRFQLMQLAQKVDGALLRKHSSNRVYVVWLVLST